MGKEINQSINTAAGLIIKSRHAVAFTGAGISTPSGIPDFRSPDSGLWNKFDPFKVASLTAFRRHPQRFYNWIRPLVQTAQAALPNPAHFGLAELEEAGVLKAIITQNIDGLHQKAGAKNVIELHGSARSATCQTCGKTYSEAWLSGDWLQNGDLPLCVECHTTLKPDVILFEELLPPIAWQRAQAHCEHADLILVIGSSLEVYPANTLPEIGLRHAAKLIIANFSETHLDTSANVLIHADLVISIPAICQQVLTHSD